MRDRRPGLRRAGGPLHRHRLTWKLPKYGDVARYRISRARAVANPAGSVIAIVTGADGLPVTLAVNLTTPFAEIGTTTTTEFIDNPELPNNEYFVYVVTATYAPASRRRQSVLQLRGRAGDQRRASRVGQWLTP